MKRFNRWLAEMPVGVWDMFAALNDERHMRLIPANRDPGIPLAPHSLDGEMIQADGTYKWPLVAINPVCPRGVPQHVWESIHGTYRADAFAAIEGWVLAGLCGGGPKVFCPTVDEFRALSQVALGITWPEYRQPFETFTLVIPDGVYATPVSDDIGTPVAMVLRHSPAVRMLASCLIAEVGHQHMTNNFVWGEGPTTRTIDDEIGEVEAEPCPDGITPEEDAAGNTIRRVAMNAALLLVNGGMRKIGPVNPEYAAKLEASLKKKHLPEHVRAANARALKAMPTVYGFDQSVRVFRRETVHADPTNPTGVVVAPHWRRGHWARVACGAGRAERRLVFREAVMVNAHLFGGRAADTRVVMTAGA